jgi:hypothetical protein
VPRAVERRIVPSQLGMKSLVSGPALWVIS